MFREFILGNNKTGLVTTGPGGETSVEGGEDAALAVDALPGQSGIAVGSISTTSTFLYPSATIAAWEAFITTATVLSPQVTGAIMNAKSSGAAPLLAGGAAVAIMACIATFVGMLFASF